MAINMKSIIPNFIEIASQFTYPDNRSIGELSRPHKGMVIRVIPGEFHMAGCMFSFPQWNRMRMR